MEVNAAEEVQQLEDYANVVMTETTPEEKKRQMKRALKQDAADLLVKCLTVGGPHDSWYSTIGSTFHEIDELNYAWRVRNFAKLLSIELIGSLTSY